MHVAFVRNCNQGQRGQPSTADLVAAFTVAGSAAVSTFRSNGTVLFDPADPADPADDRDDDGDDRDDDGGDFDDDGADSVVRRAGELLAEASGNFREIFHLPLATLRTIADANVGADDIHRRELTLHDDAVSLRTSALRPADVAVMARGRVTLLASGSGWTVSLNERDRESNATPVLERLTGGPATSRGMSTVLALLERYDD